MRRSLLLVTLLLLVLCVPPLSANPGGTGDGNRDAACGGSCHGAVSYTHLTLPTIA